MHKGNKWLLAMLAPVTLVTSIKMFESGGKDPVLKPYKDVGGVLTVCDGYTGKDIIPNKTYTPQECNELTLKDVSEHGRGVLNCVKVQITQKEYEAYTSFAYNMGIAAFCGANFTKLLNSGNHVAACKGIYQHPDGRPAWSHVGKVYYRGLQRRRFEEHLMCMEGVKP